MIIQREISGIVHDIELTGDEMLRAYYEKEHDFDRMDIEDVFNSFDDMVSIKRRNMEKYEMSWDYARDEAINEAIRNAKLLEEARH